MRALRFVRNATTAILDSGNSVSVLATDEPTRTENGVEVPIAFDWEVLRTVDRYVQSRPGGYAGRALVRAATGADSETKRFKRKNRQLIRRLQDKGALEFHYIPEDLYSGGDYRNCLVDMSDGMIAIGGGKGTYIAGDMMLAEGKPVMPMDIRIGASHGDGEGALKLLAEMKADSKPFLPTRHEIVKTGLSTLSLEGECPPVERIANEVAAILKSELEAAPGSEKNGGVKDRILGTNRQNQGRSPDRSQRDKNMGVLQVISLIGLGMFGVP